MNTPNDGGPAFPCHTNPLPGKLANAPQGMTLRDWFAGMALQGMYANPALIDSFSHHNLMSDESFNAADSMLVTRGKESS